MGTIPAKGIVYKAKKPAEWFGAEYNMNIYRGCSHGCIYCDSRSDCYHNTEFDTVRAKENALELIRNDLRRKTEGGVVGTGAMSDPYNPLERSLRLTRHVLELLHAYEFGVAIATKCSLVARDTDILSDIRKQAPVIVKLTITTADDGLCKQLEPHVSASSERFEALRALSEAGIFCGVLLMPILPYINDTEDNIRAILNKAHAAGARFVYPAMGMTLRQGNREYYYSQLDRIMPGMSERYKKTYGERYYCPSPIAKKLWSVFTQECARLELLYDMKAIIHRYKSGYLPRQLTLF